VPIQYYSQAHLPSSINAASLPCGRQTGGSTTVSLEKSSGRRHFAERQGIDAVAGARSETHPHRGGGSLRPEPLCGFGERRAEVMAFHAQFCAVPVHQQAEVEYAKAVVPMPVRARETLIVLLATGSDRDLA